MKQQKLIYFTKAYSKFNLGLDVYKLKRHELKHRLKSLFILYKSLYDEVYIYEHKQLKIQYFDSNNRSLKFDNDIVLKVINYLKQTFNLEINCYIKIIKHIPISSGLGGSSTDGASVLKYFLDYYQLKLSKKNKRDLCLYISSDLLFFIDAYDWAIVSKYGNHIKPIKKPLNISHLKLILVPIKCDTKLIYQAFDKLDKNNHLKRNNYHKIISNFNHLNHCIINNDLEPIALKLYKHLKKYKTSNRLLTGSGSSFIEWEVENESKNKIRS